jgi:hypothetical protein
MAPQVAFVPEPGRCPLRYAETCRSVQLKNCQARVHDRYGVAVLVPQREAILERSVVVRFQEGLKGCLTCCRCPSRIHETRRGSAIIGHPIYSGTDRPRSIGNRVREFMVRGTAQLRFRKLNDQAGEERPYSHICRKL